MSARLPRMVGVVSALLLAAGCQTHPANQPKQPTPPPPATISTAARPSVTPPPPASPDAESSPAVVPEALSQKTAAFARSMDAVPALTPGSASATRPPSSVKWEQAAPAATPPASVAGANTGAVVASTGHDAVPGGTAKKAARATPPSDDEPMTVPESSDFAAAPAPTPAAAARPAEAPPAAAARVASAVTPVDSATPTPALLATSSGGDALEAEVERRVHDTPQDTAAQLDYQLVAMLKNDSNGELATLASASPDDRELISALIDGLANFRTTTRQDSNMLLSAKIKPLLDMSDRLRSLAELSVDTVALCRKVYGFGRYDPMDSHFRAGRDNVTIVYCEIANFTAKQDASGGWQSKLSQQVSLFTETGMLVWKDNVREVPDTCRERRHDFFMYDMVHLPANLTIGRYILKVTVVDRLANRVAEKTLPLEIVAEPSAVTASNVLTATP